MKKIMLDWFILANVLGGVFVLLHLLLGTSLGIPWWQVCIFGFIFFWISWIICVVSVFAWSLIKNCRNRCKTGHDR